MQINTYVIGTTNIIFFLYRGRNSSIYNFCWIYNEPQTIKDLLEAVFHKVYKVFPDSTHKIEPLLKGVWGQRGFLNVLLLTAFVQFDI